MIDTKQLEKHLALPKRIVKDTKILTKEYNGQTPQQVVELLSAAIECNIPPEEMLEMVNEERLKKHLALATRVIIIMLVFILTLSICGCNKAEASNHRMRTLDGNLMYGIYVDNLTGVQYLRTSYGGLCVMVDAEGKPLIWKGVE